MKIEVEKSSLRVRPGAMRRNTTAGGEGTSGSDFLIKPRHYASVGMAWSIRYSLTTDGCWMSSTWMAPRCLTWREAA